MNIVSLLKEAKEAGVFLYIDDGKLKFKLSTKKFPTLLKQQIVDNKSEVIQFLTEYKNESNDIEKKEIPLNKSMDDGNTSPLSPAQKRLWFIDQLEGTTEHYNIIFATEISGKMSPDITEKAINTIIMRHEPLHSNFKLVNSSPIQIRDRNHSFKLIYHDINLLTKKEQLNYIQKMIRMDAGKPFDLESDLLIRVHFVKKSESNAVLMFNIHHIVSDGWSVGILLKEFVILYEALSFGAPNPLPPLNINYSDYTKWQIHENNQTLNATQLSYWKCKLKGIPLIHGLPLDGDRPKHQTFNGDNVVIEFDSELLTKLKSIALEHNVTLFMVLHALYTLTLSRISNNTDIVIGTPVANRHHKDVEHLVGFFANTVVLRVDCEENVAFSDFLNQIQQVNLQAQKHQNVPFESVVEEINPKRNTSFSSLFQIMFSMNTNEFDIKLIDDIKFKSIDNLTVSSKFDLSLNAIERSEKLILNFEYNTDLFKRSSIEQMASSFKTMTSACVSTPTTNIHQLPVLCANRLDLNQQQLKGRVTKPAGSLLVHKIFEDNVHHNSKKVAVIDGEKRISYELLNEKANQLAHLIKEYDTKKNLIIGICMTRSIEMITVILAILKSGGTYVPLDPNYPKSRLDFIIEDSGVNLLIFNDNNGALFQNHKDVVKLPISSTKYTDLLASYPKENLFSKFNGAGDNLAYIIYTSGSTGTPKGVSMPHNALANLLYNQSILCPELSSAYKTLQLASINFDVSFQEVFTALTTGSTLQLMPVTENFDVDKLIDVIENTSIERVFMTFALLQTLSVVAAQESKIFSELNVIITAGEQLNLTPQIRLFFELNSHCKLVNHYGPSETHVVTSYVLNSGLSNEKTISPIGKPLPNVQLLITNAYGQFQPQGAIGELLIGGSSIAKEYLNNSELTLQKFIFLPFGSERACRFYKSGDLVRLLEDGNIEFIGRIDRQVKIRGVRIEIGEIENAILAMDDVDEVVVNVLESSEFDKQLIAYISGERVHDSAWRKQYLRQQLPEYMIPQVFVNLDYLPKNSNGKIDVNSLPQPSEVKFLVNKHIEPSTLLEKKLVNIWKNLLNINDISADDHFFEIGGHSLLAVRLVSAIYEQCSVKISVRDVFDLPQLNLLAVLIGKKEIREKNKIPNVDRNQILPLSFAQEELYFIDLLHGGSSQYNIFMGLKIDGPIDVIKLKESLNCVIARHEILRTNFVDSDADIIQHINPVSEVQFPYLNLSHLSLQEQSEKIEHYIHEESNYEFDFESDSLIRMNLICRRKNSHFLLITMHHIISDGWSINILIKELMAFYSNKTSGKRIGLPELKVQYADYAHMQRNSYTQEKQKVQLDYWRTKLKGIPSIHSLPLDKVRPEEASFSGQLITRELPLQTLDNLKKLALKFNVTIFNILQSCFSLVIGMHSDSQDVVIGCPIAGRSDSDLELLIGYFIKSIIIRTKLNESMTFNDLFQQSSNAYIEAIEHQDIPFEKLVNEFVKQRKMNYSPIFQIMFSLQNLESPRLDVSKTIITPLVRDNTLTKFDMELLVTETSKGLIIDWNYSTSLFDKSSILSLAKHYEIIIDRLLSSPESNIYESDYFKFNKSQLQNI